MNLRICQLGRGLVVNEKNLVAVRKKTVIAAGDQAYEMYERTPPSIKVSRPVSAGVIADTSYLGKGMEMLMKKNAVSPAFLRRFHFYIAVPSDVSEVEKRAYYNLILQSAFNTRHVFLVEKPIACAIGENLSFSGEDPVMIVDMGAGSTEVSILMKGGLTVSRLVKEGGLTINETIISSVRRQFGIEIGEKTAEKLKFDLGGGVMPDGKTELELKCSAGQKITLPEAPAKEGFTFVGWETTVRGKTVILDAGAKFTVTAAKTFVALWEEN